LRHAGHTVLSHQGQDLRIEDELEEAGLKKRV
jgi:hypothetical protein